MNGGLKREAHGYGSAGSQNEPASIRPGGRNIARRLAILRVRAWELADRVAAGEIDFIEAVDMVYSAAVWSGLVADAGDDAVQEAIVPAFDSVGPT